MRPKLLLAALLACATTIAIAPMSAFGREPANQNDPCSKAGRNTCGTNGVGAYKNYRYGIRWFGDFRGAVPDVGPTFCIDLRWWYPAARYNYEEIDVTGLRNSNGTLISSAKQAQMAYAMWNYGRSNKTNQQAAVMLYVHSLMGDGAVGEVDPSAVSPQTEALFRTISRNAARYRGPYRIATSVSGGLTVGTQATATVRVLSATGVAVPGISFALTAEGAAGVPTRITTNSKGLARVRFTPSAITGLKIGVTTAPIASTLPRIFRATTTAARRNGQRMATSDSQVLTTSIEAPVAKGSIKVATTATPANLILSESNSDQVRVTGAPSSLTQSVEVAVFGPFPTKAAIVCTGTPVSRTTLTTNGSGTFTTQPFVATAPGWYTYQLAFPGNENINGLITPCAEPSENFRVQVQPRVGTVATPAVLSPGQTVADKVNVTGLGGQAVTINAALYGPFASREAIVCTTTPVWTGTLNVSADGDYTTDPVALPQPGFYTYRETIAESELVRGVETLCGELAESPIVKGTPQIVTQVSSAETTPGAQITDKVIITGLGVISATVQVELWGPYDSPAAISCSGTPFATQTFTANGDGTYTTEPITIDRAGYFSYRESLAGGPANNGFTTPCGEASETTLSKPGPLVTTQASADVVKPGGQIFDRVKVAGLGVTPATVELELFGPFATRSGIRCTGTPVQTLQMPVAGDGTYNSPKVTIAKVGFYAFRERIPAQGLVPAFQGECALTAETSLGRPLILSGKGDPIMDQSLANLTGVGGATPTRVTIAALKVNARVNSVGIDTTQGALAVPVDIKRLGWWRDGQAPGADTGAVLIAGHVDSARRGAGAFVNLKNAKAGQRVAVTTSDGTTHTYRVTTVRRMLKANLPTSVFSSAGKARLVLVTCGGPFLANQGHYRDNIVVTAVPV
jgi:Sortase domain